MAKGNTVKRSIQTPGEPDSAAVDSSEHPTAEASADPPPAELLPVAVAEVGPKDSVYWRNRLHSEAQAYWDALPEADKREPFSVLCRDGWYVAPHKIREVR